MGGEAFFVAMFGLAAVALFSLLRRERRHPGSTRPFVLGVYRGLTLLIVLLVVYAVAMILRGPA